MASFSATLNACSRSLKMAPFQTKFQGHTTIWRWMSQKRLIIWL